MGFVHVLVNIVLVLAHIILFKLALFLVVAGGLMAMGDWLEWWQLEMGTTPDGARNLRIMFYSMLIIGVGIGAGNIWWIIWRIRRMDRRRKLANA